MARNLKGLISDVRPQEQPEGSYPFGKNGIQHYVKGSTINEPGFLPSPAAIPGTVIGIVETDSTPVFVSTDNTSSWIGLYDAATDTYTQKWTDDDKDFKLGLSTDWYIKGEFQRNYKNQMIIVITDKNNPLYVFNLDETDKITTLNDVLFFLQATPPNIEASVDTGGSLIRGAYYVFARYQRNDGAETAYIANSAVLSVTNETTGIGDKLIRIKVTKVDTRYDKIQFAIVTKIDGQMTAVEMEPMALPVDPNAELNATYSGNEITTPATVTDILVQPAVYRTVGALGQLNDSLYIADLTTTPIIKWQKYANLIRIRWISNIVDVIGQKEALKKGEFKTYMHGEVMAFYARLLMTDGTKSAAFHVPGLDPTAGELATSSFGTSVGITAPVFQVENTIRSSAPNGAGSFIGEMGIWQNETETYPDDPEYDSSDIGGRNLRGQKVLHHRFPTLDYTHKLHRNAQPAHGRTHLDQLGIQVSNIVLPPELVDRVVGIEILYAKRTGDNMTVVGQSTIFMHAYSNRQGEGGTIFSTGGNWGALNKSRGNRGNLDEYDALRLRNNNARFHSFDMLFNKPSVSVNYVRPLFLLQYPYPRFRNETFFANGMIPDRGGFIGFKVDFTVANNPVAQYNNQILRMTNGKYLPTNTLLERYDNLRQEQAYVGDISPFNEFTDASYNTYNIGQGRNWGAPSNTNLIPTFEETVLCSLNSIKPNLYNAFYLQSLVTTSKVFPIDGNAFTVYGGDCFLCDYSFNTFGHNNDETPPAIGDGYVWAGQRVVRRIVCVAASNINARFKVPGNPASEWYPDSPVLNNTKEQFIARINPGTEPNQFGYSKDLNTLNEISNARPWSPDDEDITDYPYRIHRGGKVNRTGKVRSWQTLLPLDFYEAQKNMGRIINLCGVYDRLLIHHENALFVTQDKAKLESDIISVTLGSGDIFQFEPQEAQYSKLGYAGTQHDLACVLTPMGYVFVDAKQGQVFVWNQEGLRLMNGGINVFLKFYATVREKNPYIGNGITFGYDSEFNRLLFTVKNRHLANPDQEVRYDYEETPEYFATLVPGETLVFKDGRVQLFMGANSSPYSCPSYEPPVLPDYEFTILEGSVTDTVVGAIAASGGNPAYSYFLIVGSPYFKLDAASGVLKVDQPPVYTAPGYILMTAKVTDTQGLSDTATIKVNIIHVPKGPTLPDYTFSVFELQPSLTVGTVTAEPGDDPTITYAIIAGNEDGKFAINTTTGEITTTGPLDALARNLYTLTIRATDASSRVDDGVVTINVLGTPRPPVFESYTWNILDTHPLGSLIGTGTPAEDPEDGEIDLNDGDLDPYELISNDGVGTIDFDLTTLRVTLNSSATLDPEVKAQYQVRVRVTDSAGLQSDAIYTINVGYDPANFTFQPFGYNCDGGDCPPGSDPSPDGDYCITILEDDAIPPVGGEPMTASPKSNGAYSNYGTYVYNTGFNINGTGIRTRIPTSNAWWINPWTGPPGNTVNGPLNRTGLWNSAGDNPFDTYIGFSRYIDIPVAKTYYIGIAGDNRCRIRINGVTIVEQDPNALAAQSGGGIDVAFKEWHVYPVFMQAGPNLFTLQGLNDSSDAAFGAEVYDNTPAELQAATGYGDLNLIFSTKDFRSGVIDTGEGSYTCADPTYTPIDTGGGVYVCQKIVRVERTASTKTITSVQVLDTKYPGRVIVTLPNTPGQTYMGRTVPYYPPVTNSPDCTGTLYLNEGQSGVAQKNDCGSGYIGSEVTYNVPAGRYTSHVSVADANAMAMVDVNRTKQQYANDNGTCSVDPACLDASEFTAYPTGVECGLSQLQIVARTLTGQNVKVGTRAVLEGYDDLEGGSVVFTGTTAAATSPTDTLYLCANSINVSAVARWVVASILC